LREPCTVNIIKGLCESAGIFCGDCANIAELSGESWVNTLFHGDNFSLLQKLVKEPFKTKLESLGGIKLVYIDPPFDARTSFNVKRLNSSDQKTLNHYVAYEDNWGGLTKYLAMLEERFVLIHQLLAPDGSFYVHCDWRTSAHIRIMLDKIFGVSNFQNEIIWSYKSGGSTKSRFSRKHDSVLFYSKSKHYIFNVQKEKSYNRNFKPYRFKGVKEYQDEKGWYTLTNMRDVWDLDMVGRTSAERTGYPTQKPLKLLERIINASSNPGDIIVDFFSGSGTTLAVANTLKRRWIGCDAGSHAIATTKVRLGKQTKLSGSTSFQVGILNQDIEVSGSTKAIELKVLQKNFFSVSIKNYNKTAPQMMSSWSILEFSKAHKGHFPRVVWSVVAGISGASSKSTAAILGFTAKKMDDIWESEPIILNFEHYRYVVQLEDVEGGYERLVLTP
jgi:DNA modification methylase